MILKLPKRKNIEEIILENPNKIVLLGANGSGKTRMGAWIEKNNLEKVHRISAQKSLNFPESVMPKSYDIAFDEYYYGYHYGDKRTTMSQKLATRWQRNPNTSLLNDYEKLLVLLHTEEYEESVKFKDNFKKDNSIKAPNTNLDEVIKIWEELLPHRKLIKKSGCIEAQPLYENQDTLYNALDLSDGERLIFYLLASTFVAPRESIIVIDEPENHLHKSIIKKCGIKLKKLEKIVHLYI